VSEFTLQFPGEIKEEIGLHENEINSFKDKGCRFYGRKTCVAWVREFLTKITEKKKAPKEITEAESSAAPSARPQRSGANKSGARGRKSD
jgi:hypothetical protein